MPGQREQLEAQSEGLRQQNFETTFFHLLDLFRQGANKIRVPGGGEVGLDLLRFTADQARSAALEAIKRGGSITAAKDAAWWHIRTRWIAFGPYFSTVEELLSLVHAAPVPDKRMYARILRAQLSDDELSLLFFYALGPWSVEIKPLVETYSVLRNLPPDTEGRDQA